MPDRGPVNHYRKSRGRQGDNVWLQRPSVLGYSVWCSSRNKKKKKLVIEKIDSTGGMAWEPLGLEGGKLTSCPSVTFEKVHFDSRLSGTGLFLNPATPALSTSLPA